MSTPEAITTAATAPTSDPTFSNPNTNKPTFIRRLSRRFPVAFPPQNEYQAKAFAQWETGLGTKDYTDFKADLATALNDFDDGELCDEPLWLPLGFKTNNVSERFPIRWAAEGSEEMVYSYQSILSLTSKEMTDFERDLMKNAFGWMGRQRDQARNTMPNIETSEPNTEEQSRKRRIEDEEEGESSRWNSGNDTKRRGTSEKGD